MYAVVFKFLCVSCLWMTWRYFKYQEETKPQLCKTRLAKWKCIGLDNMGDDIDLEMGVTFILSVPDAHGVWVIVDGTNS